uniref:Uncharacterized protein n=1 Tax=Scophthalmus maximus TaxID=52904 RepID=A0A8D3DMQ4_SCOMX
MIKSHCWFILSYIFNVKNHNLILTANIHSLKLCFRFTVMKHKDDYCTFHIHYKLDGIDKKETVEPQQKNKHVHSKTPFLNKHKVHNKTNERLSPEDLSTEPLSPEDLSSEDLSTDDLSTEDLSPEPLSPEPLSPEDLSSEDLSTEDLSTEDLSPEPLSPEPLSPEDLSSEDLSTEDLSTEDLPPEPLSPEPLSPEDLPPEPLPPEDLSTEPLSPEDLSSEDLSTEDLSSEDLSTEDLSPEPLSPEPLSPDDLSTEDLSTEDLSSVDLSTEDLSTEDLSTDDLSTEDLSTEDLSSEDLSTSQKAPHLYFQAGVPDIHLWVRTDGWTGDQRDGDQGENRWNDSVGHRQVENVCEDSSELVSTSPEYLSEDSTWASLPQVYRSEHLSHLMFLSSAWAPCGRGLFTSNCAKKQLSSSASEASMVEFEVMLLPATPALCCCLKWSSIAFF